MKRLERLRWSWHWRRSWRPPTRVRPASRPPAYEYARPQPGFSPWLLVAIVAVTAALGGWLGVQMGSGAQREADVNAQLATLGAKPPAADRGNTRIRKVIAKLSAARADGRRDLAMAERPSAQAAAAVELRRAHLAAADRLDRRPGFARVLRRAAQGYGALAEAAETSDRRRFRTASTAIAGAERDLERLIGSRL